MTTFVSSTALIILAVALATMPLYFKIDCPQWDTVKAIGFGGAPNLL